MESTIEKFLNARSVIKESGDIRGARDWVDKTMKCVVCFPQSVISYAQLYTLGKLLDRLESERKIEIGKECADFAYVLKELGFRLSVASDKSAATVEI